MTFETILYQVHEHVALITFNRPDVLNALSRPLIQRTCTKPSILPSATNQSACHRVDRQ